jgi:hypothetical protein
MGRDEPQLSADGMDVLCVGHLADAQVLRVDRHPQLNRDASLAGTAHCAQWPPPRIPGRCETIDRLWT